MTEQITTIVEKNRGWAAATMTSVLVIVTLIVIAAQYMIFTGLPDGEAAPEIEGSLLSGGAFQLSQLQKQPVMLTFWSPECSTCRAELPAIQALADQDHGETLLVTVVSGMSAKTVSQFMEQNTYDFPVILDTSYKVASEYDVKGVPFTYFINSSGVIEQSLIGGGGSDELWHEISMWLNSCNSSCETGG